MATQNGIYSNKVRELSSKQIKLAPELLAQYTLSIQTEMFCLQFRIPAKQKRVTYGGLNILLRVLRVVHGRAGRTFPRSFEFGLISIYSVAPLRLRLLRPFILLCRFMN